MARKRRTLVTLVVAWLGVVVAVLWSLLTENVTLGPRSTAVVLAVAVAATVLYLVLRSRMGEHSPRAQGSAAVAGARHAPGYLVFSLRADSAAFTDRKAEMKAALEGLSVFESVDSAELIILVDGMPGVGKSAFARHLAHRIADRFHRVIEIDLKGHSHEHPPEQPMRVLQELLNDDGMVAQLPDDLDRLSALWRSRIAGTPTLLLLDNAASEEQVRPFLPGKAGYVVIVTSRGSLSGLTAALGAMPLSLNTLSHHDSVAYFTEIADRSLVSDRSGAIDDLVRHCGHLPLAIQWMARNSGGRSAADLLADLESATDAVIGGQEDADSSVWQAFSVSYRTLSPDRQRVLRLLGLYQGYDFDVFAAAAMTGHDLATIRKHLQVLVSDRLIEVSEHRYRMHDLVRAFARRLAGDDPEQERLASVERVMSLYVSVAARVDREFSRQPYPALTRTSAAADTDLVGQIAPHELDWVRGEILNALSYADYAAREGIVAWSLEFAAAMPALLRNDGFWTQSQLLQRRALEAADGLGEPLAKANALHELGLLQRLAGDNAGSEQLLTQSLEAYDALGDPVGVAHALNTLGVVVDLLGRSAEARRLLDRSLSSYQAMQDPLGQANVLHDIGVSKRFTGDFAGGAELAEEAFAFYRVAGSRLGEAHALTYLAICERYLGRLGSAGGNLREARARYRALGNRLGEANTLIELGIVERQLGKLGEAERTLSEALSLNRILGNERGQAAVVSELGAVYGQLRRYKAAVDHLEEAVGQFRARHNRRGEMEALNRLGNAMRRQRRVAEARQAHQTALELAQAASSDRDLGNAWAGLGRVSVARGQFGAAVQEFEQAAASLRSTGSAEASGVLRELGRAEGLRTSRLHRVIHRVSGFASRPWEFW